MNSDTAAAVRDAINGCPTVVNEENVVERDSEPTEVRGINTRDGRHKRAGDCVDTNRCRFRPAYIQQSGTLGNGNGAKRPVYVVILETLWTESSDVRSLPPEMVYEIAKHECAIRFYPPDHRLDGDVWITDHFSQEITAADGDRCECGSTYFKMRDGQPECARCGKSQSTTEPKQQTFGGVDQ